MSRNIIKNNRKLFNTNNPKNDIFVTPEDYGAVGDGVTDDSTAIQAAINASITNTGNIYLTFKQKQYKVNTEIVIDSSTAQVIIEGSGATIINGISTINKAAIRIYSAKKVLVKNLHFDDNNNSSVVHHQLYLGDYSGNKAVEVARVINCDFFNFGLENTRGLTIENTGYFIGATGNYDVPSLLIDGCNFYNRNTTALASINYNTATYYGYGIYIGERSDYIKISNCNFNYIRIGVYGYAAANLDIINSNFIACLPKTVGVYTYGAIYISNTGLNNGKVNIVGCKFNHNFGYSIYCLYNSPSRPITIFSNHFIANCATPIYITSTGKCMIHDNWFERASQAFTLGLTNQPFGAALLPYINLVNSNRNSIKCNSFYTDATYGVLSSGTSDYNMVKNNNWHTMTGMSSLVGANNVVSDNDNI